MYSSRRRGIPREEGGGGDNDGNDTDDTDGTDDASVGDLLPPGGI